MFSNVTDNMLLKLCVCLLLINFGLLEAHKQAAAKIPRGPLVEDNLLRLQVHIPEDAKKFEIRLQNGGEDDDKTEILLDIEINLGDDELGICAKKDGKEMQPMKFKNVIHPDKHNSQAEVLISVNKKDFHININGHFAEFPIVEKIPMNKIDHWLLLGDAELELAVLKSVSKKDLEKLEKK